MSTAHNGANKGDIAKVVLMPGDPLRAQYIAETYLKDIVKFNTVRNMFGFTGTYKGKKVSVMGSGMGMPSIGIYSYELFTEYDVECIIRIGSAGSYIADLNIYDVVLAKDAWSESSFAKVQSGYDSDVTLPNAELNDTIMQSAKELGKEVKLGRVHSSDVFYRESTGEAWQDLVKNYQVGCVEMESFALFHNANVLGKKAACLLTISDSFITNEVTSAEERQTSFNSMMEIALETAIKY